MAFNVLWVWFLVPAKRRGSVGFLQAACTKAWYLAALVPLQSSMMWPASL